MSTKTSASSAFSSLEPSLVISLIEEVFGLKLTNLCRKLASYINRVFELEAENGERFVVKFYRPGRWSKEALEDEHEFLYELQAQDLSVIAPLRSPDGESLLSYQGVFYTVFPFRGGRNVDEFSREEWTALGRLVGRMHLIGSARDSTHRITLLPEESTERQAHFLLDGGFIPSELEREYEDLVFDTLDYIHPLFDEVPLIRIHGDMHPGNILHRPPDEFLVLDFDDMALGPAVQDFWMLLPDYRNRSEAEIDLFLEGYETFFAFPRDSLRLIEPLRFMRYIHFSSWCAHQAADGGHLAITEDWGSPAYWQKELEDMREQQERIFSQA